MPRLALEIEGVRVDDLRLHVAEDAKRPKRSSKAEKAEAAVLTSSMAGLEDQEHAEELLESIGCPVN